MSNKSFRTKLASGVVVAFMGLEAILTACGGKEVAVPTQLEAEVTPPAVAALSGAYCDKAQNTEEQFRQFYALEASLHQQNSSPKSLEEIMRLGEGIVMFLRLPIALEAAAKAATTPEGASYEVNTSQGLLLGEGYYVTVSHTFTEQVVQVKGADYSATISPPDKVLLINLGIYKGGEVTPVASQVKNITTFPNRDIAVVYSPSNDEAHKIGFRPSSTLKRGEKLYNVKRESNGELAVREGEVLATSITASGDGGLLIYFGQILTSIGAEEGDSGSPIFDRFGNLVGVASVGGNFEGKAATTIASIDSLAPLLAAQKQQLTACTPAK